jgi:hypothetical protein
LQSTPTVDPWFGVAAGWEILHGSTSSAAASTSSSLSGFELLTLQGGADFALANAIAAGPFVSLSFGEYLNASTSGVPGVPDSSSSITNKALHEWLTFGVRGTYGIALP